MANLVKFIGIGFGKAFSLFAKQQMIVFKEAEAIGKYIQEQKEKSKTIGFVPTMGALHDGHISLIKTCTNQTDLTVCSIFVNPAQFNDPKDFKNYPVTISNDIFLLEKEGCHLLFLPSVKEMYPNEIASSVNYDLGQLETVLEGKFRPGHFQGVCQVVHRLLDIVMPDYLILGQKDYQQCLVIKRLVHQLNLPVKVITEATHRESAGLAMSSRNLRLTPPEKEQAAGIFKVLNYIKKHYNTTPLRDLEKYAIDFLLINGFSKVDYVSIADADTLQPVADAKDAKHALALIAAFIGEVRLIDNIMITE